MATSRTYDDSCGVAHALELVGERWAMLVMRELMLGPQRFSDLRANLPGISANVLSHRLDELERSGLLRRDVLPPPAASRVYALTAWGRELEPVLRDLGRWAARSPRHRRDLGFSPTSLVLALRTNVDDERVAALDGEELDVALVLDHVVVRARVVDGAFAVDHGDTAYAQAVVTGPPPSVMPVLLGFLPLADAEQAGVSVTGDRRAVEALATLFTLPEPAPLPAV